MTSRFLPTAYVVREEVIFSACLSVHSGGELPHLADVGGGGYPIQLTGGGTPGPGRGGYPIPGPGGGVPHPAPGDGGYPIPGPGGYPGLGTPPAGCTPLAGVPPSWGTPPPHWGRSPGWGTAPRLGYPAGWGTPPPHRYLLRRGRYASCVHAGGLSCLLKFHFACVMHRIYFAFGDINLIVNFHFWRF